MDPTEQASPGGAAGSRWRPFASPLRLGEVGSTNAELARLAGEGAPEGTVVVAESQLAGRGRLGRSWLDEPGGSLLCSLLLRPSFSPTHWYLAGLAVAVSAVRACRRVSGAELSCKWPNDLLAGADGPKLGGVLAEVVEGGALVVGIGLNCHWPGGRSARPLPEGATTLEVVTGRRVDKDALLDALLEEVATRWAGLSSSPAAAGAPAPGAAAGLRSEYRSLCATIGRLVRVELVGGTFGGRAVGLDGTGRLLVQTAQGTEAVAAGDVVHLRPTLPAAPGGSG